MNNKGFTLIELLIIIVILSVLIAIIIPGYQKFKEEQKTISNTVESTSNEETIFREGLNKIKNDLKELLSEIQQITKEKREEGEKLEKTKRKLEKVKEDIDASKTGLLKLTLEQEYGVSGISCEEMNSLQIECIIPYYSEGENAKLICTESYNGYDCKLKK
ncbi:MAG: prepilin-type N-terminal cleavage/methylation domain-containing protein [Candidatus Caldatribacteriota bacterium]